MGRFDGWRFCPRCAAEIAVAEGQASCPACGFIDYAHSSPTASALLADEAGRVLLVRRAMEPEEGKWDLPGGFVDEDEHPLDALRRELGEETGLEIEPLEFFGVWIDRYGGGDDPASTLNLYWTARICAGDPRPSAADEISEVRWFAPEELPSDAELAFRNVAEALRAWAATRR